MLLPVNLLYLWLEENSPSIADDRNICRTSGGPQGGNVSWSAGGDWVGVKKMTSRPGASLVSLSAELC